MQALETVIVVYKEKAVPCEIALGKMGGALEQEVAKNLYDVLGRPRGPFALLLPASEPELARYGTRQVIEGKPTGALVLIEGKPVLKSKAVLDKQFFELCAAASARDDDILVYDLPPAPQGARLCIKLFRRPLFVSAQVLAAAFALPLKTQRPFGDSPP